MKKIAAHSAWFAILAVASSCVVNDEAGTEDLDDNAGLIAEGATLAEADADADADADVALALAGEQLAASGELSTKATGSYSYSTSNTNSAQQGTINKSISLIAGQKLMLGTCGVTGSAFTGDTYVRLFGPGAVQVSYSDDACGGMGSNLEYTVPTSGTYEIRGGCYSATACTATVAWSTSTTGTPSSGSYSYSATNTNNAAQNTSDLAIRVTADQRVTVSICATFTGDPYLRIANPSGTTAAYNDDGCATKGATSTFLATATGNYTIHAGCYSTTSCTGTVVWSVQ